MNPEQKKIIIIDSETGLSKLRSPQDDESKAYRSAKRRMESHKLNEVTVTVTGVRSLPENMPTTSSRVIKAQGGNSNGNVNTPFEFCCVQDNPTVNLYQENNAVVKEELLHEENADDDFCDVSSMVKVEMTESQDSQVNLKGIPQNISTLSKADTVVFKPTVPISPVAFKESAPPIVPSNSVLPVPPTIPSNSVRPVPATVPSNSVRPVPPTVPSNSVRPVPPTVPSNSVRPVPPTVPSNSVRPVPVAPYDTGIRVSRVAPPRTNRSTSTTKTEPDPEEALHLLDDHDIESEGETQDHVEDEDFDSEDSDDRYYLDLVEDCDEDIEKNIRKLEIEEKSKIPKPPPAKRTRSIADVVENLPLQEPPATEVSSSNVVKSDLSIILGRDGTKWGTVSKDGPRVSDVRPGPVGDAKLRTEPIGCFRLFFSESIIKKILTNTNEKISEISKKFAKPEGSIQATSIQELEALFGVLFLSAALRSNHLPSELLFQTEYSGSRFVATMSRRRFEFLINSLRFDELETRQERKAKTKLAPINEIWDMFVDNCMKNYVPSGYVTIDQQHVSFRGKCPFRVRKSTVPRTCGLKILMMCDNANKYMLNAIPHLGKESVPADVPESEYYVKELVEPIKGSHRNITMGKQFTSVPLVRDLLNDYELSVVGAVRNNSEELPACFVDIKHQDRKVDSSFFIFSEEVTAVSYKPSPSKLLYLLSSLHHEVGAGRKPQVVTTYSKTKGAVSTLDEMCKGMSTSRKSRRWSMCLFYNMLNIAAVNSYVIYLHNFFRSERTRNQKPLSRINFMLKLSEQLTSAWQKHRLEKIPSLSKELKLQLRQVLGIVKHLPSMNCGGEQHGKRTYCAHCHYSKHRMTSVYCSTCGRPICGEHQKRVCVDC